MGDNSFYAVLVSLIGVLLAALTWWKFRKTPRLEQYSENSRDTGGLVLALSIGATEVGGGFAIGMVALGYEFGLPAALIGLSYAIGYVYVIFCAPRIYTRLEETNDVSYLRGIEQKYGSLAALLGAFGVVIAYFCILSAQLIAGASFLAVFIGLNAWIGMFVIGGAMVAYTAWAGLPGVLWTDKIQLLAILAIMGFLVLPATIGDAEVKLGLAGLSPDYLFDMGRIGWVFTVGALVFLGPANSLRPDIWQRVGAAKGPATAKRAFAAAIPIILLLALAYPFMGICAKAIEYEGPPEGAAVEYIKHLFTDKWWRSTVLIAVMLAIISTGDSVLNMCGIIVTQHVRPKTREIWRKRWAANRGSNEWRTFGDQLVRHLRVTTLVIGLFAIMLALHVRDIVALIVNATTGFLIFMPTVCGVLLAWKGGKTRPKSSAFF